MKLNKVLCSLYLILSYSLFFLVIKLSPLIYFSFDLLFLFSIFNCFIAMHFIIDIKKMYNFIYKKRYLIGIILLLTLSVLKYNGSSIDQWNNYIEPQYRVDNGIVFGMSRGIRSDEWLVGTPTILSQATNAVNFSSHNKLLRATNNLVTFYPNLPSRDLSILAIPQSIPYLFLDKEIAFSFSWFFPYFLLFFTTFELCMILSKKKLLSVAGAFLITLSPVIQWWQSPQIVAYGNLAMVLFYKFLTSKSIKVKLLLSVCIGYSGFLYIMCMYPAWQIPYGYCYFIIMLWLFLRNRKNTKFSDLLFIIPAILVIACLIIPILMQNQSVLDIMNNTVYPGARMSLGGGNWKMLMTYVLDIFLPFKKHMNPCEYSQYISFFPLPTICSIYMIIKHKEKDVFIILSTLLILFLFIWCAIPLPSFISKITLIYMSTSSRVQSVIGYLSIIQLIYFLGNYSFELKKINFKKIAFLVALALIFTFFTIKISNRTTELVYPGYVNIYTSLISLIIFAPIVMLIISNYKKSYIPLCLCLIIISFVSGAFVSPINKGLDVMYDKPVAKKIRKIMQNNSNSKFIAVNSGTVLSNYIVANGGKTLNSTNYLPNLKLYHSLDSKKKYENVYNRYEHVVVNLVDEKTNFELNYADSITINLNYSDVCKVGVDYLVTTSDDTSKFDSFKKIYGKYNVKIYQTNCE